MKSFNKQKPEGWQKTVLFGICVTLFLLVCAVTSYNSYHLITLRNELNELKIKLDNCLVHNDPTSMASRGKRNVIDYNKIENKSDGALEINGHVFPGIQVTSGSHERHDTLEMKLVPNSSVIRVNSQSSTVSRPVKKQLLKSLDHSSEYGGDSDSEFRVIREQEISRRRYPRVGRVKLPAIHFNGDTSKYNIQLHDHYKGNGHIRHLQRTFMDWKPSYWVNKAGMDNHFDFDAGTITIKESGLYFIYAQIYYLDEHDRNGYAIEKNNQKLLMCTVAAHSEQRLTKGNTCYTAGVDYVAEGDTINIVDLSHDRYSIFDTGKSFFGLVKLSDVKIK
ncbi:uncharacterized protein LOC132695570 [Cylas formicarius]|uniref:uncharacterized protein LOC132695570 n=1 Tax=Cylas formicarius TaxID=197179 RepID=UPI002958AFFB|nr:uncharacterized protein LOC132695570 [Cylas formicarius]